MKKYFFAFYLFGIVSIGTAQLPETENFNAKIQKLQKERPSFQRDSLILMVLDEQARKIINSSTPDSTWSLLNSMEVIYQKYKWPIGEGRYLYRRGHYYMTRGNTVEASNYFMKALKVFSKLQDIPQILRVYNYLGVNLIYNDFSDSVNLKKGIAILQKGVDISLKTPDKVMYGTLCYNIGYGYHKMNRYPAALAYIQKTIISNKERRITEPNFGLCLMLAVCYARIGDKANLARYLKKCEEYKPELSVQQLYEYNYEIAEIYNYKQDFRLAEKYCSAMLVYAELLKAPAKVIVAERLHYQLYKKIGKTQEALRALERLKEMEDRTFNQRSKEAITEIQLKYEAQANQEQISELTISQQVLNQKILLGSLAALFMLLGYIFYNNRQLRQKNRKITQALLQGQTTERKRVAADLHDTLGSTLSSLRWSLAAIDKNKLNPREQEVYEHVQNSIEQSYDQVRLLSHNLLPEELEKQGLWVTLEQLVRKLNKNTPVKFSLQLPDNQKHLDAKTEFELYSICLELTNNILKHAQATEAAITFEMENQVLRLTIRDNGKGISEKSSSGKGLRNISERVESLKGNWETVSNEMQGIKNVFTLPLGKLTKQAHA